MAWAEGLFEDGAAEWLPTRRPHVRNSLVFRRAPHSTAQPQLVPPSVEEIIDLDDPVRAFKILVFGLDLNEILATYFPYGGVGYEPKALVAVFLYAAMLGVHTTREIEKLCKYDLRFWFLTDGQVPDFTTLSRFRIRLMQVDAAFFSKSVKVCRNLGLGNSGVAAIDGRKTAGALDQWMRLRKDATEEELAAVSDSEARTLWCRRSGYVNGYTCMVGADMQDDIILGTCVTNESSDNTSLGNLLEAIETQSGVLPATMVMDAGFNGSDCTAELAAREVEAFISPKQEEFWDLDADGEVICPMGHRLEKGSLQNLKTGQRQVYSIRHCPKCPVKGLCGVGKGRKSLTVHQGADPRDWVRAQILARTPEGRKFLAYRKGSIERLFAQLFYHQKFRRFTMRGPRGAGVQLHILSAAHNLWLLASRMTEMLGAEGIAQLKNHLMRPLEAIWAALTSLKAIWIALTDRTRNRTMIGFNLCGRQ